MSKFVLLMLIFVSACSSVNQNGFRQPASNDEPGFGTVSQEERQRVRSALMAAEKDGGWTGGGGDGVACFGSKGDARSALNEKGALVPSAYAKIKELYVREYWEFKNHKYASGNKSIGGSFHFIEPVKGQDADKFFDDSMYIVQQLHPFLAARLTDAKKLMGPDARTYLENPLPYKLHDVGEVKVNIPDNCVAVQFAIRYAKSNPGHRPKVFIDIDKKLWDLLLKKNSQKIGVINQTLLEIHEAFYLLAVELGHYNSQSARNMSAFLLSFEIQKSIFSSTEAPFFFGLVLYQLGYRQFVKLFLEDLKRTDPEIFRKLQMQQIYTSLMNKYYRAALDHALFWRPQIALNYDPKAPQFDLSKSPDEIVAEREKAGLRIDALLDPDTQYWLARFGALEAFSQPRTRDYPYSLPNDEAFMYITTMLKGMGRVSRVAFQSLLVNSDRSAMQNSCEQIRIFNQNDLGPRGKFAFDHIYGELGPRALRYCRDQGY